MMPQTTKATTYMRYLDVIKGIAIILVVMGHLIQRTMIVEGNDFFEHPLFKAIYTVHMPIFFYISGYLLRHALERKGGFDIIQQRFKGLMLPFFSWGLLGALAAIFLQGMKTKAISIGACMTIIADQVVIHPMVWFLWVLFVLLSLVVVCVKIAGKASGLVLLTSVIIMWIVPTSTYGNLFYIKWFYPYCVAGYLFPACLDLGSALRFKWCQQVPLGSIMGLLLLAWLKGVVFVWGHHDFIYVNQMQPDPEGLRVTVGAYGFRYGMGLIGIALLGWLGQWVSQWRWSDLLVRLGQYSMGIYLVQRFIVELLYEKIYAVSGLTFNAQGIMFNAIILPLLTVILMAACYLLTVKVIAPLTFLNTILLGGRKINTVAP